MSRVIAVPDSHTLVVETDGRQSTVALRDVFVPAEEEAEAADFLRLIARNTWVYVEDGNVYRSPDALFVNGELIRHAWRGTHAMKYLGQLDLGARPKNEPAAKKSAPAAAQPRSTPPPRTIRRPRRAAAKGGPKS